MTTSDFSYHFTVNDRSEFELNSANLEEFDLIETKPGSFHLIHEDQNYHIEVDELDLDQGVIKMRINGQIQNVKIETPLERKIKALGINELNAGEGEIIKAPMPGKVLSILVNEGDTVEEHQDLLVLEAMKMENVIKSTEKGTVEVIHVQANDNVNKNDLLVETSSVSSKEG
jgi:biotin carboxyl carrier protein